MNCPACASSALVIKTDGLACGGCGRLLAVELKLRADAPAGGDVVEVTAPLPKAPAPKDADLVLKALKALQQVRDVAKAAGERQAEAEAAELLLIWTMYLARRA